MILGDVVRIRIWDCRDVKVVRYGRSRRRNKKRLYESAYVAGVVL